MNATSAEPLNEIDSWFKERCDNLWEHQRPRLKLEATDNPGWLMTIDQTIDELAFKDLGVEVRKRWNAECNWEQDRIRIYAVLLKDCVHAAAHILATRKAKY
jgi:hypothetical protein